MNLDEYGQMFELEDHYWWFVARRQLALRLLKAHPASEGATLDVGCGTGAMLSELLRLGPATGIDVSPEALSRCRLRGLTSVVEADAEQLPFKTSSFAKVVTLDTLEHVRDDHAACAEIFRVLQPGAVVVINVPAFRWLWGPHDVALHHHRRYTKRELITLLKRSGFEVERASYSVFFLFPVVVMVRLLDRLRTSQARVRLPQVGPALNKLLIALMRWEGSLLLKVPLPVGSSVVAVARKPIGSANTDQP